MVLSFLVRAQGHDPCTPVPAALQPTRRGDGTADENTTLTRREKQWYGRAMAEQWRPGGK